MGKILITSQKVYRVTKEEKEIYPGYDIFNLASAEAILNIWHKLSFNKNTGRYKKHELWEISQAEVTPWGIKIPLSQYINEGGKAKIIKVLGETL